MNESPIRKFCESPHRRLIVAIVTTLVGLVVLLPLVDDYFDKKESRRALVDELDRARLTAKTLPKFEQRVVELSKELDKFEARSVSQERVSQYRSKLVDLVRKAECQVRRLDLSVPTLRPWRENDDPLAKSKAVAPTAKKTPFTLERRSVVLLVDGTMQNICDLLEQLYQDQSFAYPRRVDLRSASRQGDKVTLELELWLFALSRHKAT